LSKDEAKTIAIIKEIKSNPEYTEFIDNEMIDGLLSKINIKLGKIAPTFSVELLNGKTISLGDYSGKFVFIDFWGSWCAPCRQEIPNIKKLYSSLSRDKLEIIGLAQDDEKNLRNYIEEQKIEYPNALASKELLAKYGISRFPTSFLINPKGKIVRIDVRGNDAMELIREEIEDYYN
jgi:peroxiredoxin